MKTELPPSSRGFDRFVGCPIGVLKAMPWLVAAITALLACEFVVMRGEDQNWDLLNYHYYSGYAVVNGRFADDVAPSGLQTYLHPLNNVLTFLAFSKLVFPFSSLVLLAFQLLVLPALVLLGREVGKGLGHQDVSVSETLALAVGLAAPVWWSELGTLFYSSTTASIVLFGVWFLMRGAAEVSSNAELLRRTAGTGACMGLATALKLTNAIFLMAAGLALIPTLFRFGVRSASMRALAYSVGVFLGFAVVAWWYLLLYREFDNPVFPLFNGIFRSNYFDAINFRDPRWTFSTLGELLRFPVAVAAGTIKTSEVELGTGDCCCVRDSHYWWLSTECLQHGSAAEGAAPHRRCCCGSLQGESVGGYSSWPTSVT